MCVQFDVGECPLECQVVSNEYSDERECQYMDFVVPCSWRRDCPAFCDASGGDVAGESCASYAPEIEYAGVSELMFRSSGFARFDENDTLAFSFGLAELTSELGVIITSPEPIVTNDSYRTQIISPPWQLAAVESLTIDTVVNTSESLGMTFSARLSSVATASVRLVAPVYESELVIGVTSAGWVADSITAAQVGEEMFRYAGASVDFNRARLLLTTDEDVMILVLPIATARIPHQDTPLLELLAAPPEGSRLADLLSHTSQGTRYAQLASGDASCGDGIYPVYYAGVKVYRLHWWSDTPAWEPVEVIPLGANHVMPAEPHPGVIGCPSGYESKCINADCGEESADQAVWPFALVAVIAVLSVGGAVGAWYVGRRKRRDHDVTIRGRDPGYAAF